MDLLNRYLQAVRFWLPKKQKHDIIAELSEDIRSQIEERQAEVGRKPNESEVAAILKQCGRPVLVANRFLPQEHLIGPVLFPIYLVVLKIVAVFYMVPWILVWLGITISRASHSGLTVIVAVGSFWTSFWPMAFFLIGGVTTVFAILERVQAKSRFMENWDPLKLPPVRHPNRIPFSASLIEVVANLVFCIWWVGGMWYQPFLHFSGVSIRLAPVWRHFYWGFLILAVANAVVSAVNLFRPYWTWLRASIRLATNCIGSALFCWSLQADLLVAISVPNVSPTKAAEITNAINWWMSKAFPAAIAACVVIIALPDVYRIIRVRSKASHRVVLNAAPGAH